MGTAESGLEARPGERGWKRISDNVEKREMGDEENALVDMASKEEQRHRASVGEEAGDCCGAGACQRAENGGSSRSTD